MPLSIPDARTMSRSSCDECRTSSVIVVVPSASSSVMVISG